ncbi:MAG: hypothetical protein R2708_05640 [Vicinamibacterales bacterium]
MNGARCRRSPASNGWPARTTWTRSWPRPPAPPPEAENGSDFLAAIAASTGIRARVITGTEEARLIHRAAVYGVDTPKPAVVVDIGGGGVEVTLGAGDQVPRFARSFKLGAIRLSERFVTSDPVSRRDVRRMEAHIGELVDRYLAHVVSAGFDRVIGTSGTILSAGAVALALESGTVPTELRSLRVPARAIRRLRKVVCERTLDERLALPGMDPRRADLVVAGTVLLDGVLRRLDADEITLCDLALREGLVLDFIQRNRRHIRQVDEVPDVRRRSVLELAERFAGGPPTIAHGRSPGPGALRRGLKPCMTSAIVSASGSSTARCSTTSAPTSASSATTATRTTSFATATCAGSNRSECR